MKLIRKIVKKSCRIQTSLYMVSIQIDVHEIFFPLLVCKKGCPILTIAIDKQEALINTCTIQKQISFVYILATFFRIIEFGLIKITNWEISEYPLIYVL